MAQPRRGEMTLSFISRASAVLALVSLLCNTAPCYAEVSLLGVTLGKSLSIRECRLDKYSSANYRNYDLIDNECYTVSDYGGKSCFTELRPNVSFYSKTYIGLEHECNRNSNVIHLEITIRSEDFDKVLALMVNKFGKPSKTENSDVQNRMGASFPQTEAYWTIEGCELYLARLGGQIDEGVLTVSHPIYLNKIGNEHQRNLNTDASKF